MVMLLRLHNNSRIIEDVCTSWLRWFCVIEDERMVSFGRARFLFAVHVELRDVKNGRWMMEVVVDITST
jgi:hypothetical protein